jgi:hypothetical protein
MKASSCQYLSLFEVNTSNDQNIGQDHVATAAGRNWFYVAYLRPLFWRNVLQVFPRVELVACVDAVEFRNACDMTNFRRPVVVQSENVSACTSSTDLKIVWHNI